MEFILLLAVIGLFVWMVQIHNELRQMRENQMGLQPSKNTRSKKPPSSTSLKSESGLPWEKTVSPTKNKVKSQGIVARKLADNELRMEDFISQKILPIAGIVSLVLAIGFFTVWSFSNGWVGASGRIAIGIMVSLGFLITGELTRSKQNRLALAFTAVGIGGLIVTTFSARYFFDFLTSAQAMIVYITEIGVAIVLSLRYQSRLLGSVAILSGLIAPLLTHSSEPIFWGLVGFLLVLSGAGFTLATYRQWPEIWIYLFLGNTLYWLITLSGDFAQELLVNQPLLILFLTFALLFFPTTGSVVRMIRNQGVELRIWSDQSGVLVAELGLLAMGWLTSNSIGFYIFQTSGWADWFGFFVLAQGLLFYSAGSYFGRQGWQRFERLTLAFTLGTVLFATLWQFGTQLQTAALILTMQSVCFLWAGRQSAEKIFSITGLIFWFLALGYAWVLQGSSLESFSLVPKGAFSVQDISSLITITLLVVASGMYATLRQHRVVDIVLVVLMTFLAAGTTGLILRSLSLDDGSQIFVHLLTTMVWVIILIAKGWFRRDYYTSLLLALLYLIAANFSWMIMIVGRDFGNFVWLQTFMLIGMNFGLLWWHRCQTLVTNQPVSAYKVASYVILVLSTSVILTGASELTTGLGVTLVALGWSGLLVGTGIVRQLPTWRQTGLLMLGLVIAKIYLIDLWNWEVGWRFVAFGVLGVLLLILSYLYQKKWKK